MKIQLSDLGYHQTGYIVRNGEKTHIIEFRRHGGHNVYRFNIGEYMSDIINIRIKEDQTKQLSQMIQIAALLGIDILELDKDRVFNKLTEKGVK